MTPIQATADAVIEIARGEIGTHEEPIGSNRTKYGKWFGLDGYAWCAIWVSWVLNKVGITRWRHSYTPTGMQAFKDAGLFKPAKSIAKPGWLVYFNFDSDVGPEHVGIVTRDNNDGTISTIEGNTSPTDAGSQANGDGVYRKIRSKSLVLGYGAVEYVTEPPADRYAITAVKIVEKVVTEDRLKLTVANLKERGFMVKKELIQQ